MILLVNNKNMDTTSLLKETNLNEAALIMLPH